MFFEQFIVVYFCVFSLDYFTLIDTPIDWCLIKNKKRLAYDTALADGLPIASGVIEGACRHLINDRLDITGARWSLAGAEAMLKLRSLKSSGDFDEYWSFHKKQSKLRLYTNFNLMDE